ncbi:hypothetical protein CXB51_022166 [Gossypium anomalum]|uniref:Aminotransferase-like plant mobile domain-containing protein n=1 Tax=Gossypium anomalum TaxID=47600 RepID=A0A8J5Y5I8_9ROSI|nr:hypothetical protein CXB51_022166 [Gossypium anomalum]
MSSPPSPLIENYLREVDFWHVTNIGQWCKLDPKPISAFIERWRLEMHTFHLPCEQLRLPVDGSVLTGSVQSADWGAICYDLLEQLANLVGGLPCWQHCTGRCAGRRNQIKLKSEFQWTPPYEDPAIWAIISDKFFQNLNIWHVKVPLVNYATVEMHQTDSVTPLTLTHRRKRVTEYYRTF